MFLGRGDKRCATELACHIRLTRCIQEFSRHGPGVYSPPMSIDTGTTKSRSIFKIDALAIYQDAYCTYSKHATMMRRAEPDFDTVHYSYHLFSNLHHQIRNFSVKVVYFCKKRLLCPYQHTHADGTVYFSHSLLYPHQISKINSFDIFLALHSLTFTDILFES